MKVNGMEREEKVMKKRGKKVRGENGVEKER